jgi:HlyD family secretion protein
VPIQSLTVREKTVDAKGAIVETPAATPGASPAPGPAPLQEGQTRKELEGVFVVREGKAVFVPVKIGIGGEKYFEVLSGLVVGDEVITGPPTSVRGLREGDAIRATGSTPVSSPPAR